MSGTTLAQLAVQFGQSIEKIEAALAEGGYRPLAFHGGVVGPAAVAHLLAVLPRPGIATAELHFARVTDPTLIPPDETDEDREQREKTDWWRKQHAD